MKKTIIVLILIMVVLTSCQSRRPVDYVDPFICTEGDHGQWLPAALVPFGLVELCPDTYPGSLTADGDFAHSGYDFSDSKIRGFSHFHKGSSGGTSIHDRAGQLSFMPFTGTPDKDFLKGPLADVDKKSEKAHPGYYSVHLTADDILAELSATTHTGYQKYTFSAGKSAKLFLFEGNKNRSGGISFKMTDETSVEGVLAYNMGIYYVVKFSSAVKQSKVWDGNLLKDGENQSNQVKGGLVCDFGDMNGKPLEVRVGVSLISMEDAYKNLETENPVFNFSKIKNKAADLWNEKLSRIMVEGNDENKTIFYTALYHTCFLPQETSDVSGDYPGLDQKIHKADGYIHYDNYAFWDSFRTKYPLYSLYLPDVYIDIVKSLRDIYEQADNWAPFPESDHKPHGSGFSPRGKNGFEPFITCRHEHMLMAMTDAYFKGLFKIDLKSVYPYIRNEAMVQMPEKYDTIGYIPARADQTGEYCWDNWSVAQLAKEIDNQDDADYFTKRSKYWVNTWDSTILFFRARAADGSWLDFPDDPTINREKYTYEGSKWQWRWNVLHDVPALIGLFHGKENFSKALEYFFENNLYTAGNQIDLQAPFLFNYAGTPWLTQKWVHTLLTEKVIQKYGTHDFFPEPVYDRIYKTTPDGYLEEMDDDYGCMSSWYAMSAMGLYQMCPGNPVYQLTAPIFKKVTINLNTEVYGGKSFVICANGLSSENYFIQSATLNGKPYNRSWISHEDITKGGRLVFEMGNAPNKEWGKEEEQ